MINWALSPRAFMASNALNSFEVSIEPPNAQLLGDLVLLKGWTNFVYVHDVENAYRGQGEDWGKLSLNSPLFSGSKFASHLPASTAEDQQFGHFRDAAAAGGCGRLWQIPAEGVQSKEG